MIEAWLNLNSRASAYLLEGGGGGPGTIQVGTFDYRPKPPESVPSVIIMFALGKDTKLSQCSTIPLYPFIKGYKW